MAEKNFMDDTMAFANVRIATQNINSLRKYKQVQVTGRTLADFSKTDFELTYSDMWRAQHDGQYY